MATSSRPEKITKEWFRTRYGQNFPDLLLLNAETNTFLDNAIEQVYTVFYGVGLIWSHLEKEIYISKTQLCYGLLLAWYITDLFPSYAVGVMTSGGIPVSSKQIGNVKVSFSEMASKRGASNNADILQALKSNSFGAKAYMMIKASGKLNLFFSLGK